MQEPVNSKVYIGGEDLLSWDIRHWALVSLLMSALTVLSGCRKVAKWGSYAALEENSSQISCLPSHHKSDVKIGLDEKIAPFFPLPKLK